jgi:glycosyltransferase involved in cell wall biosynthesis
MDVVVKRVLYISYDGMTDPLGQSQVIPYLRELTKQGYQFTLLSVEKKQRLKESGTALKQLLTEMGIEWETLLFTTQPPLLSKVYDQQQLNATAIRLHKEKKFDMIHCRSYVAAAAGIKLLHRFGVPFLFDMRGFWVDERVDSGHWRIKNPLYRFLYNRYKKKEKKYFSGAAHIISLTEKGKEELIKAYAVPAEKITVIPCCADLEHFDYHKISEDEKQQAKKLLGIESNNKILSYLGSLGGWYMTDEMLDFFAVMKESIPDAKFLFITKDNRKHIISKAVSRGINEKDILVQPAARNEVPLYLSVSDWSIFFIKDVYSKKASSPTKQGEIMGMGIPLICNDIGDTGSIVTQSDAGILVKDFSQATYKRVTGKLESLLQHNKEISRTSAYKYYDLQNGVASYKKIYRQLIG